MNARNTCSVKKKSTPADSYIIEELVLGRVVNMLGVMCLGDGPRAHLQKLAECIRWSYGAGIVLRLGNIARLELNYCVPMGVQSGDR